MIIYQFHGYTEKEIQDYGAQRTKDGTLILDDSCSVKIDNDASIPIIHITKVEKK